MYNSAYCDPENWFLGMYFSPYSKTFLMARNVIFWIVIGVVAIYAVYSIISFITKRRKNLAKEKSKQRKRSKYGTKRK